MSSSIPIDSAWSLLQSDDKIEKVLPLLIPAAMAAYGGYQGYKNVRDNQITDPVLGIKVGEGGDSFGSNLAEFGTGVAQGFVPGSLLGAGARRAGGKVAAKHGAKNVAARQAQEEARQRAARELADIQSQRALSQGIGPSTLRGVDDKLYQEALGSSYATSMGNQALRANSSNPINAKIAGGLTAMSKPKMGRAMLGGAALGAGALGYQAAAPVVAGLAGAAAMSQLPQPGTGFASQMGNVGTAPAQQTQVSGNADPYAMRQIWKPQDNAFEQQSEFGGLGVQKGDNMFKNNIGEELLKEASDRMYKASCAQCNKKDCLGKMHCSMNKAECPKCGKNCKCDDKKKADDKKKPAHGMVIVIGSKAGPGPSTDGKRDKVDSEKDKKEE